LVGHYNQLQEIASEFIAKEVAKDGKKVVITHHLPSPACNVKEFKGSVLEEAFCVDKTDLIMDNEIDFWIYGHSHRNKRNFKLGNTTMVTNQLGYVDAGENNTFKLDKVIKIKS